MISIRSRPRARSLLGTETEPHPPALTSRVLRFYFLCLVPPPLHTPPCHLEAFKSVLFPWLCQLLTPSSALWESQFPRVAARAGLAVCIPQLPGFEPQVGGRSIAALSISARLGVQVAPPPPGPRPGSPAGEVPGCSLSQLLPASPAASQISYCAPEQATHTPLPLHLQLPAPTALRIIGLSSELPKPSAVGNL